MLVLWRKRDEELNLIDRLEIGDFNKHSRIWICLECLFVDGSSLERD